MCNVFKIFIFLFLIKSIHFVFYFKIKAKDTVCNVTSIIPKDTEKVALEKDFNQFELILVR